MAPSGPDCAGGGVVANASDTATYQLLHKIDTLLHLNQRLRRKKGMRDEAQSLEFWRAIIAECLAAFFYVFLMCGCYVPWPGRDISSTQIALTCGLAMCTLTLCFGHISGAHINPALTVALLLTRKCTPLRAFLYVTAQCGGAIAGAALLYGVSVPGYQGTLGTMSVHASLSSWQGFGIEFVLTFIVVFTVFATSDPHQSMLNIPSPIIGCAYLVCSLAGLPSTGAALNPARALGPAFVMNKWTNHWIYWFGPMTGGLLAGLIYEYIFDPKKGSRGLKEALEDMNRAESSLHSQDEDYDDGADSKTPKFSSSRDQYVSGAPGSAYRGGQQHYDHHHHTQQHQQTYNRAASLGPLPPPPAHHHNGVGANYTSSHNNVSTSAYGPLPPPPPSTHQQANSTYGMVQHNGSGAATYGPGGGGGAVTPGAESVYGGATYRPQSNASGNYATIHGNRPGTMTRIPQRMEYGPGSTKF